MSRLAQTTIRALAICLVLVGCFPGAGAVAATETWSPATAADVVRTQLFDAQSALLEGNVDAARSATAEAGDRLDSFLAAFGAESTAGTRLLALLESLDSALAAADADAFAQARGEIWTTLLAGSFEQTLAAIDRGDTVAARSWLLLREYRPATRFARAGADATLAIRDLAAGTTSVDSARAAVMADLLETYQSNMASSLHDLSASLEAGFSARSAELAGAAHGYWLALAPAYELQTGAAVRAEADALIDQLAVAPAPETVAPVSHLLDSFRAAPLTEAEQARRAGQLLLYLSLIPVEYGRGVKDGQVLLDIEIQEALSFFEGAQVSFSDLRLSMEQIDPAVTAEAHGLLAELEHDLNQASLRQNVVEPGRIKELAGSIAGLMSGLFPEEWTRSGGDADFDVIATLLDEVERAAGAGLFDQAESARLEAYAIYEMGPEKRLMGFAPKLARDVEALFWQGSDDHRGLAFLIKDEAGMSAIRATRGALDDALEASQTALGAGPPADGAIIFNAATIVFREGLEAVLILVSLTASMIGVNRRFKKPLAAGAALAMVASALLFVLAATVLDSLSRYGEKLEAIVSLIAIAVLLVIMNWFFHKVYWTRWIAGHHAKRRAIIGGAAGQMLGLVLLGFTSVFREGGETVLFLQALVLDAGVAVVIEGVALGLAGVAVVGFLVFAMQKKLPHKKMLIVTGVMIAAVLVVMVGNTVHVLQVVGWLPITPIGEMQFPYWAGVWLGLFPTWESVLAQVGALILVLGSYFLAEYQHDRSSERGRAEAGSSASVQRA